MNSKIQLRKDRAEQLYLSTNADENANVQLLISTESLSFFLDFTLEEAQSFRDEFDHAIAEEKKRLAWLAKTFGPKKKAKKKR